MAINYSGGYGGYNLSTQGASLGGPGRDEDLVSFAKEIARRRAAQEARNAQLGEQQARLSMRQQERAMRPDPEAERERGFANALRMREMTQADPNEAFNNQMRRVALKNAQSEQRYQDAIRQADLRPQKALVMSGPGIIGGYTDDVLNRPISLRPQGSSFQNAGMSPSEMARLSPEAQAALMQREATEAEGRRRAVSSYDEQNARVRQEQEAAEQAAEDRRQKRRQPMVGYY